MRQRGIRVGGDVLSRYLGQHALGDPEKRADLVESLRRLIHQQPVADDQDLLAREQRVQVLELLAVAAEADVVPEAGPARGDPAVLLATGPDEVADRLEARRPQMRPVRVRPFDRIAHDHDQPGAGNRLTYPAHRGPVVQVQRRRLAPERAGRSRVEQGLVIRPAPYLLAVGQRVPRAAPGRRRSVGEEELRLLDRGQVKARVTGQRDMQRRGARLRGTDHQEVGQGHGASRNSRRILHVGHALGRSRTIMNL